MSSRAKIARRLNAANASRIAAIAAAATGAGGGAAAPVDDADDDATLPDVLPQGDGDAPAPGGAAAPPPSDDDDALAPDGAAAPPPSDAEGADAVAARNAALVPLSLAAITAGADASRALIHSITEGLVLISGDDADALSLALARSALGGGDICWASPPSDELDRLRVRVRARDAGVVLADTYISD
jgi:hypothetical protein